MAALIVFGWGLTDGPFVDEYAYITQCYYADLFFGGDRNDPAWLDEPFAIDLQPIPKYLVGASFRAAHLRRPRRSDAFLWYQNAHTRFGPPEALTIARLPILAVGVAGVLAIFGCGLAIGGRWTAALAGLLLIADPLYRLHAHRAMSDVPCEAFTIGSFGLALVGLSSLGTNRGLRSGILWMAMAGIASGLAIDCKLNGLLGPMVIASWSGLLMIAPGSGWRMRRRIVAVGVAAVATMLVTLMYFNPTYTCRPRVPITQPEFVSRAQEPPWARFRRMVQFRLSTAEEQRKMEKFDRDVVRGPAEKAAVFAVQGFGRFGPLGPSASNSEVRYDASQDWGTVFWWPIVILGVVRAGRIGRRQIQEGHPPTAWALLVWAAIAWAVVAAYLPLAWDRYFLPIQAPNALLGALALAGLLERRKRKEVID